MFGETPNITREARMLPKPFEQLELFGPAFDGARRGWDCPTMSVTLCLKRRPSMPLVAQCVLFI
jgi:hypothetical protein